MMQVEQALTVMALASAITGFTCGLVDKPVLGYVFSFWSIYTAILLLGRVR